MRAHLHESLVVLALLAHEHRVHRRLHVVVNSALANSTEEAERPLVRVEHHLLALARVQLHQKHPAVAQAHVRGLHPRRLARQHHLLVAPVELIRLARCKDQRHIRLGGCQSRAPAPPPHRVAANRVVAPAIPEFRQRLEDPQQRQTVPLLLPLTGLQAPLQLLHPRAQLGQRLNLALVTKRRLVAAHHLAHRVPRQPQLPRNLLDRDALAQVFAADPRNRLHNQHLPPPRSSNQRGEFLPSPDGGSILDADHPPKGVNIPRLITLRRTVGTAQSRRGCRAQAASKAVCGTATGPARQPTWMRWSQAPEHAAGWPSRSCWRSSIHSRPRTLRPS